MQTAKAPNRLCIYIRVQIHISPMLSHLPLRHRAQFVRKTASRYNGPAHEILVLINSASSEGSDESAHVSRHTRTSLRSYLSMYVDEGSGTGITMPP